LLIKKPEFRFWECVTPLKMEVMTISNEIERRKKRGKGKTFSHAYRIEASRCHFKGGNVLILDFKFPC
jgi:hypothetical protein